MPALATRARVVYTLYAALLLVSALGAALASQYDAPYGAGAALEAVLWSTAGGLMLAPLFLGLAGSRRATAYILAPLVGVGLAAADYWLLYTRLYRPYAARLHSLAYHVAYAPLMFVLTLLLGIFLVLGMAASYATRLLH